MPSNNDLKASIQAVAIEKNIETPDLKGKSNTELASILENMSNLEAKKINVKKTRADKEIEETEKKVKSLPPYRVADGKSITCKKGILTNGHEMKVEYLSGGQETLDLLVKRGFITKK